MHVTITLNVVYDSATVPDKDTMTRLLLGSIEAAVARGLLSPSGKEVIDEYSVGDDDIEITIDNA